MKTTAADNPLSIKKRTVSHLTGSCLCGGVSYRIEGPARDIVNCYCSQCRKTSGHYVAATRVSKEHFILSNEKTLQWYECLPSIFRGFCNCCGGNLFWDNNNDTKNEISIMAGTLDTPTHLKTIENIYTEDASDYCEIYDLDSKPKS